MPIPEANAQTLRFGIVGVGRAAASTAPAMARHPRVEIVAAADSSPAAIEKFQQTFPCVAYGSIEAICADPNVDAVYIATPTHLHTQHVIIAAEHGKHVIVEKPLAINLEDADRMIAAVEKAGVYLVVGQSQSYEPPIRAIREIVKSGQIGKLRLINGWYYNDWLYRPRLPAELDTKQGGGVVYRQGAHHFDLSRLIAGGMAKSVRATTGVWDAERPTEGSYSAFIEFENGAVASLVYSGYDHFHSTDLTGASEGGTLVDAATRPYAASRRAILDAAKGEGEAALKRQLNLGLTGSREVAQQRYPAHFGLLIVSGEHGDIRQTPSGLTVSGDTERWDVPLDASVVGRDHLVSEMYDAAVNGAPPLHNGRWAKATLEISLAVLESSRTHGEVHLKHQVPTNDE